MSTPNFDLLPSDCLLRLRHLIAPAGPIPFTCSTVYRKIRADSFPQPIRVGGASCWRVRDIRAWLAAQSESADSEEPVSQRLSTCIVELGEQDEELERLIAVQANRLATAPTKDEQREASEELQRLHALRSPSRISLMEQAFLP